MLTDVDLVFDYYTGVNFAAGGYATLACRVKDDKLEKLFEGLSKAAMQEAHQSAGLIIKLGGRVY